MGILEDGREGICIFRHLFLFSKRFLVFPATAFGCSRVRLLVGFIPALHDATYFYDYWSFQQEVNPDLDEVSMGENSHVFYAYPLVLLKSISRALDLHELASTLFSVPQEQVWSTGCSKCIVFAEHTTNDRKCFSADALFNVHA